MPLRFNSLTGNYLIKPPSNQLCVIISKPGGAVLYSDNPHHGEITLSVTAGHKPVLLIPTGGGQ